MTYKNSGFVKNDSTPNRLLDLTHNISRSLGDRSEVFLVFLDITKAFDKVYHDGLLFKLEQFGITWNLLAWFKSYLSGRRQRVVIDGRSCQWCNITAGVPQGSILGPLLFLILLTIW